MLHFRIDFCIELVRVLQDCEKLPLNYSIESVHDEDVLSITSVGAKTLWRVVARKNSFIVVNSQLRNGSKDMYSKVLGVLKQEADSQSVKVCVKNVDGDILKSCCEELGIHVLN